MREKYYLQAGTFWSWNARNWRKTVWLPQAFLPTSPYHCCSKLKEIPTQHLCAYGMTVGNLDNLQTEALFIRAFKILEDDRKHCFTFWHGRNFKKYSVFSTFLFSPSNASEKHSGSSSFSIVQQSWKFSCIYTDWILVALLDCPSVLSFQYFKKTSGSSNFPILEQSWKLSCISTDWILVALL